MSSIFENQIKIMIGNRLQRTQERKQKAEIQLGNSQTDFSNWRQIFFRQFRRYWRDANTSGKAKSAPYFVCVAVGWVFIASGMPTLHQVYLLVWQLELRKRHIKTCGCWTLQELSSPAFNALALVTDPCAPPPARIHAPSTCLVLFYLGKINHITKYVSHP